MTKTGDSDLKTFLAEEADKNAANLSNNDKNVNDDDEDEEEGDANVAAQKVSIRIIFILFFFL